MIYFICLGLFSMGAYIVFNLIKNEKAKKKWLPNMKVGDEVNFTTLNNNVNAVITNLNPTDNENIVEVRILVEKKSLYPGSLRDIDNTIL